MTRAPSGVAAQTPIDALTSLRFFMAAAVVFYHLAYGFLPSKPFPMLVDRVVTAGHLGVNFFFLLSGFILALNYLGPPPEEAQAARAIDRRAFFTSRIARVYPLYLASLAVCAPFVVAHRFDADGSIPRAVGKTLAAFGVNALLLQAWIPQASSAWNFPSWTLSVEAFFYVAFPFVAPRLWRARTRDGVLLLAAYAAGLALPLAHRWLAPGAGGLEGDLSLTSVPVLRCPEFFSGVVLARVYLRAPPSWARWTWALWLSGLLALLGVVFEQDAIDPTLLRMGLVSPFMALMILGFSLGEHRWISKPLFVLLGKASYGVYILHIPVFLWFAFVARPGAKLAETARLSGQEAPLAFVGYLGLLLGVSIAGFYGIEEPSRRWLRRALGRAGVPSRT